MMGSTVSVRLPYNNIIFFRVSLDRGWELMWLATGCFTPSTNLLEEVTLFLRSMTCNQVATDSLNRLQKTLR